MKNISFSNNLRDITQLAQQYKIAVEDCQIGKDQEGFLKRIIDSYIGTCNFPANF